ncbi:MAG TPA: hypothetical protein VJL58_10190, partial [Pyrinomonadaceae bacterium]|nr:hypothetical protein [Pyrinomonadaceae bacterium]
AVYRIVHFIRQQFGFSDQEKLAAVVRFIGLGAATIDELVDETNFRKQEIYELVGQLEATKRVKLQSFSDGRPGPPRKLIVLIE